MESSEHWNEEDFFRWFYKINTPSWYEYAQNKKITDASERQLLYRLGKHAEKGTQPTIKQLRWAKRIVERFVIKDQPQKVIVRKRKGQKPKIIKNIHKNGETLHATARMAWHDNKWNGKICSDPENNKYCVGDYSLLSNRLRRRRKLDIECDSAFKSQVPSMGLMKGYIPPCYWSINAFGSQDIDVEHEHPMRESNFNIQDTPNIPETLPPFSIFTWPFKLSFIREGSPLRKIDGKYPKNLVDRVERFSSKLVEGKSIIFLYCNYDNPISADDYKYLLVGCGFLESKGDFHHYEIPEENLNNIRGEDGYQNFPTVGWDIRLSLDNNNIVRLPYHEYLEDAEKYNDFTFLEEIKVIIDEPELVQSFKYVAMDIDDDRAIYLLTKIKKSLLKIREHGRYSAIYDSESNLLIIEDLLEHCWKKRGHLPGFKKLNDIIFDREDDFNPLKINLLFDKLAKTEQGNYVNKLIEVLENPNDSGISEDQLLDEIDELKRQLRLRKVSLIDYLKISMLNITKNQFRRILKGVIGETKRTFKEICDNPYLIYEEYEAKEEEDAYFGDRIDGPINLFEIDIAFFPDTRYLKRFRKIQNIYPEDPFRVRALTISYLKSIKNKGDCFELAGKIEEAINEYPLFYKSEYELPDAVLSDPEDPLLDHFMEKIVIKEHQNKLFFYLKEIYETEIFISNTVIKLMNLNDLPANFMVNVEESIITLNKKFEGKFDVETYRTERQKLFSNIFKKRFYVLSGSPGSGKSYELLRIVDKLQKADEDCLILTPTGKAALRLSSNEEGFKNIRVMTIDKFLYDNRGKDIFDIENVIIDEMSMVDLIKFAELLRKINFKSPYFRRLILVGDQHQLPPIGFGKVYVDIIRYILNNSKYSSNYCCLETNCRQYYDENIINFSKIYSGQCKHHEPLIQSAANNTLNAQGLKIYYWKDPADLNSKIIERFKELYADRVSSYDLGIILNRVFNLHDEGTVNNDDNRFYDRLKIDNFQVITPYRAGFYGSIGLNDFFQNTFRSNTNFINKRRFSFKHSDKIIQTKNRYYNNELILSNGSMGIVEEKGKFYFVERQKPIYSGSLDDEQLELAYSITVHKSQGSGFEEVFFILPAKKGLLYRELLYTALTRSKKSLSIFVYGDPGDEIQNNLFEITRKRSSVELRKTSLLENPYWDYTLSPKKGVLVKSRAEYIIYKKLEETQNLLQDEQPFYFDYEKELKPKNSSFKIKPDFTITAASGKTFYLEHLGLLTDYSYKNNWYKRLKIYEKEGLLDCLITTDEMSGISDTSVEKVIEDIVLETIKPTTDSFSQYHYSL